MKAPCTKTKQAPTQTRSRRCRSSPAERPERGPERFHLHGPSPTPAGSFGREDAARPRLHPLYAIAPCTVFVVDHLIQAGPAIGAKARAVHSTAQTDSCNTWPAATTTTTTCLFVPSSSGSLASSPASSLRGKTRTSGVHPRRGSPRRRSA